MAKKGDNVYKMTNQKRGPFIIINNETFADRAKREGTEHDVEKLRATFGGTFGFEVVVHNNQTADEIRGIIKELGEGDYSDCNCFGLAILTHGKQDTDNIVYGCDGVEVDFDEVFEPLKTCESLGGKPKLILVQAGPLSVDVFDGFATDGEQDPDQTKNKTKKIPKEADFSYYFAMDVPAGCNDWIFANKGSIFIQTFCGILQKNSDGKTNFETLKTQANGEILKKSGQMPTSNMTLTGGLFLAASQKPGLDEEDENSKPGLDEEDRNSEPGLDEEDGNSKPGLDEEDRNSEPGLDEEDGNSQPGLDEEDGNSTTGPSAKKKKLTMESRK